jgi:hypothetical protein
LGVPFFCGFQLFKKGEKIMKLRERGYDPNWREHLQEMERKNQKKRAAQEEREAAWQETLSKMPKELKYKSSRLHWEKKGDIIYIYDFEGWHSITHQTWADWVYEMLEECGPNTKIARGGNVTTLQEEMEYISSLMY